MENLSEIFNAKITALIKEISDFQEKSPNLWKEEYSFIQLDLEEVLDLNNDGNFQDAEEKFNTLVISKHENFDNYVKQDNQSEANMIRGNNVRVKLSRAKRKNKKCPICNTELNIKDNTYVCRKCDYTADVKTAKNKNTIKANENIYIQKQLSGITGVKKPPANIIKIIPYISTWLTEMKYIINWLKFKSETQTVQTKRMIASKLNYYEDWKNKYYNLTDDIVDDDFPKIVRPKNVENYMNCELFKLFTDELFRMLVYAKSCSKIGISNMEVMEKKDIIKVFEKYIEEKGQVKPDLDETFRCTINEDEPNKEYDIGHYINELSLLFSVPSDHVKHDLEKMFNISLTIPGLMFNFKEVYNINENVPQCYNYAQEYPYIIHETFKIPYANISIKVKELITDIMVKFNEFHKKSGDVDAKNSNSPLFCCTLENILDLPYFQEYKDAVMKFLPKKDKNTVGFIKTKFFMFINEESEYLKQFYIIDKPTETIEVKEKEKDFISLDDDIF